MSGNVLTQYLDKQAKPGGKPAPEAAEPENLGMFGLLRGMHERAIALEIRFKDGRNEAFPYAYLQRSSLDPSEGITLRFGGAVVRITGRNLNAELRPNVRLFSAIAQHRVPWIEEAGNAAILQAGKGATVIEQIELA